MAFGNPTLAKVIIEKVMAELSSATCVRIGKYRLSLLPPGRKVALIDETTGEIIDELPNCVAVLEEHP